MAITDMAMGVKGSIKTAVVYQLLFHITAHAAESELTPTVTLEEVYSDNVELSSVDERDSFVTRATLGLNHAISTTVVDATINGAYTHQFYSHDSDANEGYESLNTRVNVTPWRKGPTFNFQGSIANVPRSIGGNFTSDLISGDTIRYNDFGGGLSYQAQNRDFVLTFSGLYNDRSAEDDIGNSYGYNTTLRFQNGVSQKHVFWDLIGSYGDRNNRGRSARSYQVTATLGLITDWHLNPFIRYFDEDYTGNISNNNLNQGESIGAGFRWQPVNLMIIDLSYNQVSDDALSDDYVAFDFNWQPSNRTQINANYNQRFFGDSYGLNISHRNKRLTNSIVYNEQIRAFERDNFEVFVESTVFCPVGEPLNLDNCLGNLSDDLDPNLFVELPLLGVRTVEDNQFFLYKRLTWRTSFALPRTTFDFSISGNEQENLNTSDTQEFLTLRLNATRRLNPRSTLNAGFQFTRNDYITNNSQIQRERQDYYRTYTLSYSRDLTRELSWRFELRHLARTSSLNNRAFDENRATLSIKKDF